MSSICGVISRTEMGANGEILSAKRKTTLKQIVENMLSNLNHWDADKVGKWYARRTGFGHLLRFNSPESLWETQPFHCSRSNLVICADARLDNRDELCELLSIGAAEKSSLTEAELILKTFQYWGKDCAAKLCGDFAFAIWDIEQEQLYCARDQLGVKSLFYHQDETAFIFASEVKCIKELSIVDTDVDENWLAFSLCLLKPDKVSTFYQNIKSLAPAHFLVMDRQSLTIHQYWSLDLETELNYADERDYLIELREKIRQAVQCRVRSAYPIGCELSGGLDSSYITSLSASALNGNLHTFSHVQSDEDKRKFFPYEDERKYIELMCKFVDLPPSQCNLITHKGRGATAAIKRISRLHGSPALSTQTLFGDELYQKASSNNIRTMLTGLGGDHLASSYGLGYREQLFVQNKWNELWQDLSNSKFKERVKTFLSLIVKLKLPIIYSLIQSIRGNLTPQNCWKLFGQKYCIEPSFAERMKVPESFNRLSLYPFTGSVREIEAHQISSPLLVNRIENSGLYASSYGIELRHPLLDVRLIEYCLSLPANLKQRYGLRRYLFRKAMRGIVPEEIRLREDKARHSIPSAISQFSYDLAWLEGEFSRLNKRNQSNKYVDAEKVIRSLKSFDVTSQPNVPLRAFIFYYMTLNYFSDYS